MSNLLIGLLASFVLIGIFSATMRGCDYYHVETMKRLEYQQYICKEKGVCVYRERRP